MEIWGNVPSVFSSLSSQCRFVLHLFEKNPRNKCIETQECGWSSFKSTTTVCLVVSRCTSIHYWERHKYCNKKQLVMKTQNVENLSNVMKRFWRSDEAYWWRGIMQKDYEDIWRAAGREVRGHVTSLHRVLMPQYVGTKAETEYFLQVIKEKSIINIIILDRKQT